MNIEMIKEQGFFQGRLFLIFLVGFILGISLKNIAIDRITIGYNDYKLENLKSNYIFDKKSDSLEEPIK